mmetsp:Transcript_35009/g.76621  ORF Transcript_35009/g.76621 Transcript_35009/m.76621 type:complete len:201 (+) Transcript_35009:249-851(+)
MQNLCAVRCRDFCNHRRWVSHNLVRLSSWRFRHRIRFSRRTSAIDSYPRRGARCRLRCTSGSRRCSIPQPSPVHQARQQRREVASPTLTAACCRIDQNRWCTTGLCGLLDDNGRLAGIRGDRSSWCRLWHWCWRLVFDRSWSNSLLADTWDWWKCIRSCSLLCMYQQCRFKIIEIARWPTNSDGWVDILCHHHRPSLMGF